MKQIKIIPILIVVCLLVAAVVVYALVSGLTGGYNPDRYIELGQYENLSVTVAQQTATDKDVETALHEVLAQLATEEEATDGAKEGDVVNIDYVGTVDGVESENFTAQDMDVTLGKDSFIVSGMDDVLMGVTAGDTPAATLTVQENYYFEEDVGKQVSFAITVNSVTRTVVPELTDELAKKLGDYTTAEEFKAAFKEQYLKTVEQENDVAVRNELWYTVLDNTQVDAYPSDELTLLIETFRAEIQAGADEYEMEFIDYASYLYGVTTQEEYDEYEVQYNQEILKQQMVLKSICKKEKITLSDNEYKEYLASYLELLSEDGYTEDDLLTIYGGEEGLREQFLRDKAVDLIRQTATVTFEEE